MEEDLNDITLLIQSEENKSPTSKSQFFEFWAIFFNSGLSGRDLGFRNGSFGLGNTIVESPYFYLILGKVTMIQTKVSTIIILAILLDEMLVPMSIPHLPWLPMGTDILLAAPTTLLHRGLNLLSPLTLPPASLALHTNG
jgi:hypothetical protein